MPEASTSSNHSFAISALDHHGHINESRWALRFVCGPRHHLGVVDDGAEVECHIARKALRLAHARSVEDTEVAPQINEAIEWMIARRLQFRPMFHQRAHEVCPIQVKVLLRAPVTTCSIAYDTDNAVLTEEVDVAA